MAAYSAWDVIPYIINRERCGFPVMGGWEPLPEPDPNPRQQLLNDLIADTTRPNAAEVIDSFLYQAAREHLLRHKPRVLFIGFLETDAWGHAGRYDNLLTSANAVDQYIQRLWETMQSMDQYRDKTTFIISTDHGRGSGLVGLEESWQDHRGGRKHLDGVSRAGHTASGRTNELRPRDAKSDCSHARRAAGRRLPRRRSPIQGL